MTTIELNEVTIERPRRTGWLARLWAGWKRRRSQRLTLLSLSQMDTRLLRDIGIEPMDVMRALDGLNRSTLSDPSLRGGKS